MRYLYALSLSVIFKRNGYHQPCSWIHKMLSSAVLKNIPNTKINTNGLPHYYRHIIDIQNFKVRGAGADNVSSSSLLSAYSLAHSSLTLSPSRLKATGVASALRTFPETKSRDRK